MSFIANILSQIKQPSKKKEVHPQLEQMLKKKDKKKSGRKKYVVLSVMALFYIFSTIFFTFFFKQEVQNVKTAISMIKNHSFLPSVATIPNMDEISTLKGMGNNNDTSDSKGSTDIDKNIENSITSIQNQYSNLQALIQKNSNKNPDAIEDNLKNTIPLNQNQHSNLPLIIQGDSNSSQKKPEMTEDNPKNTIPLNQNQHSNLPLTIQGDSNGFQKKPETIEDNQKNVLSVVSDTEKKQSTDKKNINKNISKSLIKEDNILTNKPQHKPAKRHRQQPKNDEMLNTQNDIDQTEKDGDIDMDIRVKKDRNTKSDYIDSKPTTPGRHLYAGLNLEKRGEYNEAFKEYKLASISDGVSYSLLNRMAVLLIKTHRYSEAVEYAKMALKIKEDYTPAIINMAIAYAKSNHIDLALETFEHGLNVSPYDSELLYNAAVFYERNNHKDSAHNMYSRLVDIGDNRGKPGMERTEPLTEEQK